MDFLPNSSVRDRLQFAWDSTSIGALKKCPRFYQLSVLCGFQSAKQSVHLTFGLHYHAALERYDHARASGEDHESALRKAARFVLEVTWDKKLGRPWNSEDSNKNRLTLLRSVVWYLDQYEHDSLETVILENGKPAVELSFRFETSYQTPWGEPFLLCGHLDKLVRLSDSIYIMDHKTSKHKLEPRWFEGFTPFNQFTLYTLASKVVYKSPARGVIVNGAQIAVTFTEFGRGPVERSDFQLDEWYKDFGILLTQAQQYASLNYWPMNDTSCDKYGGCEFRSVCSKKAPNAREDWLRSAFIRRTWDPLIARGDI